MQVTRHCAVTYRIYPDKAQAGLIDRTIGCARLVYNLMLETRIDTYNRTGKSCNPTPAQYKDEYPFLHEVDSLALCNAQLNVAKAYNNFLRDPSMWASRNTRRSIAAHGGTRRTTTTATSDSSKEADTSNFPKWA